ncbi:MAG: class I SAM-dependent methyltransferase [Candidatus Omnitrophica bacterium]|nr:class I SAM-dependent methyltransferase [Candidatus Omnitrophota bacterium]
MENKTSDYYTRYLERVNFYKSFGYDIEKERKFILEKSCPFDGDILEVGTGKGYFTVELAKAGYNFTSVDVSYQEQDYARRNIKYFGFAKLVNFQIENAEQFSFKDASFDTVFVINAIHHFENPYKVMDELIRVTSFEGKFILSDFNEEGLKLIGKIHESEGRTHKAGSVNLNDIGKYLQRKDFSIETYSSKFQEIVTACHSLM